MESMLLDAAGHRRSPATMPGYHRGRPPRNKGEQYPADPPTAEAIVAVMRAIDNRTDGHRLRASAPMLPAQSDSRPVVCCARSRIRIGSSTDLLFGGGCAGGCVRRSLDRLLPGEREDPRA